MRSELKDKRIELELDKKIPQSNSCVQEDLSLKELFINWFKIRKITLKQLNNRYSDFICIHGRYFSRWMGK